MTATSHVQDDALPWQQAPGRALVTLAWPIVISLLSYSAMTIVDTWFVSRLGAAALAGTGVAGTVMYAAICFPLGFNRAVKTLISQSIGAGRRDEMHAYLKAGLIGAVAMGVALFGLGELLASTFAGILATPEAGAHAQRYLSIRLLGVVPMLCGHVLGETRTGLGDSRSPMRAALIANAVHGAVAYLFIVVLELGVSGAAWSSVLAQTLECGLLLVAQRGDGFRGAALRAHHWRALWTMGWPTATQFVLEMGSFALLSLMLASFSERDMAAHQIGIQLQHLAFMPALAIGEAASVLAARAVGAARPEMVRVIARRALQLAAAHTALCTLVLALGAGPIARLFTDDADLARLTSHVFYMACLFMVADACNIVARCTLRGTGDVRVPAVVGIASTWLMTPPLTYLLGLSLGWGVLGAWLGLTGEILLGAAILWRRLLRDQWRPAAARSRRTAAGKAEALA